MKKPPRHIKYLFFVLTFLASSIWFLVFSDMPKYFSIDFFDVGSGDAILIRTPDNFKILVDGGPSSRILERLGKAMGPLDRKIDLLILTHPHEDHVFGAFEALKRYEIKTVLGTGVVHTNAAYLEFLDQIKKKNINYTVAEQGQIFKFGELELEVLYPFEKLTGRKVDNLNNSSIVFRARYKSVKALFLGDIEEGAGEKLLKNNFDLRASILKTAHQGSKNGAQNLPTFLERVNPQISVILVGENKYGHPHKETIDNLNKKKIKTLRADKDSKGGSVKIESDGETLWVK